MAQVYGNRYEIVDKIARGGMADVFRARDLLLDRLVALKLLFPELSTSSAFVERFRREATAAANLSHPNIVSVFDSGRSDSSYFIVMELVDGQTLGHVIRSSGPLDFDYAAAVCADVALALDYAHRHGVVHRDVKPGNVLIASDGHVKVADFGIARAQSASEDLTQTGSVMGTATYISPEQAEGRPLDGRSDVYSLGIVLYEMLAGKPPFVGDSAVSVALKQVKEIPPSLDRIRADIPRALLDIVAKALSKDPADRYSTAQEFRSDLLRFIQRRPINASGAHVGEVGLIPSDTTSMIDEIGANSKSRATVTLPRTDSTTIIPVSSTPTDTQTKKDKRGTLIAVLAAIVVLAVFFVVYSLVKGSSLVSTTSTTLAPVSVPSVVGNSLPQASATLASLSLKYKVDYQQSSSVGAGIVLSQNPSAGASIPTNSSVTLDVSSGAALVSLPNVVNQTLGNAESQLVPLGFSLNTNYVNSASPNGTVIKMDPTGGGKAPQGSTVTLTVSNGPATISVPDVTNQPVAQAGNVLGSAGLTIGNTSNENSDTVPSGDVISTNPVAGTQVAPNSAVDIVISSGPTTTTTTTAPTTTTTSTTTTAPTTTTTSTTTTGPPGKP